MSDKTLPKQNMPQLPEIVHFGRAVCGDLVQAERREWWLANWWRLAGTH